MKRLIGLVATAIALSASADWFYLKDGVSDWTADASYEGGKAPTESELPSAIIALREGVTATVNVSDVATTNFLAQIDHVYLMKPMSRVIFNTPNEGDVITYSKRMSSAAHGGENYSVTNGCIVKRGLGKLVLKEASNINSFSTRIEVQEGEVHMSAASSFNPTYGHVAISNGASFFLPTDAKSYCNVAGLWGDGLVTTTGTKTQVRVGTSGVSPEAQYSEFRGVLDTEVWYYSAGRCVLSGLNKTKYPLTTYYGKEYLGETNSTGLAWLPAAEGSESPTGLSYLKADDGGGSFTYWGGNTELFSTSVRYEMKPYAPDVCTFSAGTNGNLRFTGKWALDSSNRTVDGRFCVAGDNTVYECVLDNDWNFDWTKDGVDHTFEMLKTGSGVWHIADRPIWNTGRAFSGPVSVRAGTLRVDSLYDAGVQCCIGSATRLLGKPALSLGAEGTEGTIEYSGSNRTNGVLSLTRTATLVGDGRFLNNDAEVPFRFRGVSSAANGRAKTLTLDGSSTLVNTVADITDEESSPVGVTKRGTGTWYLTGTNSFHGPVDVKAGKLVVRNCNKYKYNWFRWTVCANSGNSVVLNCQEFCLYDGNGVRQNVGLKAVTNSYAVVPGSAAVELRHTNGRWVDYGNSGSAKAGWHHIGRLFDARLNYPDRPAGDDSSTYRVGWCAHYSAKTESGEKAVGPQLDDPDTWVSVVMCLADSAAEIARYDLVWGNSTGSDPTVYKIEGSADGLHWDPIKEVSDGGRGSSTAFTFKFNTGVQSSDNGTPKKNTVADSLAGHNETVAYPVLNNCESVSVAAGAELVCEGEPLSVKGLKVDANGAGTLCNFALDDVEFIDVDNLAKDQRSTVLPGTYENVSGLDGASTWEVRVGGVPKPSYSARYANGKIYIDRPGALLILR